MQLHTPRKLTPITRSQSSRDPGHDPRVVERGVESAELGDGTVHHRGHLGVVAHITTDGEGLVTGGDQLLGCGLHRLFFEIRENDGRARLCERLRRRESHPCCRPGDERHFAAEVQWVGHGVTSFSCFINRLNFGSAVPQKIPQNQYMSFHVTSHLVQVLPSVNYGRFALLVSSESVGRNDKILPAAHLRPHCGF